MSLCNNYISKLMSKETECILFMKLYSKDNEEFKSLLMAYARIMKLVKKWPVEEYLPADFIFREFDQDMKLIENFIFNAHSCYCGKLEDIVELLPEILKSGLDDIASAAAGV